MSDLFGNHIVGFPTRRLKYIQFLLSIVLKSNQKFCLEHRMKFNFILTFTQSVTLLTAWITVYAIVTQITPYDPFEVNYEGYGWDFISIFHLIIIIIGSVSNACLVVLLIKDKGKKTSVTVYFGAMAVCDTIQLAVFMVYEWLFRLMYFAVEDTSSFGCKFIVTLEYIAKTLSTWLVIALIIERLIYLHFPRMTKLFNRRMTGICVISMLVTIWYLFNSHYMLWFDLKGIVLQVDNTTTYFCKTDSINLMEYTVLYKKYILPILCGICPVVCILIGNVFFIKALYFSATTRIKNGRA